MRNRLQSLKQLAALIRLSDDERQACEATTRDFRLGITPYYASLIDREREDCPIRLQAIPRMLEMHVAVGDAIDPLAEDRDMPVAGLTWRYPDRVLLYTSHQCAVFCRHCTRRRKVSDPESAPSQDQLNTALRFIADHSEIRDVVLSGGDPLSLSNERLGHILESLRAIPHVEIIRIGTRHPVTLPQRIDDALCALLRAAQPVFVHTHFNHPRECTREAFDAAAKLADAGCVLGNQMVLLRGVNDRVDVVSELNQKLLMMRVRPYYMFQCDLAQGVSHFRVPLERGIQIVDALRGQTSGMAVPQFVVDLPDGRGKVALSPDSVVSKSADYWLLKAYNGEIVSVPSGEG
jgi:lysine 2,3-aminomutase